MEVRRCGPRPARSLPQESGEVGLARNAPDAILAAALADERACELLEVIRIADFPEQSHRAERASKGLRITSPRRGS